MKVLISGTYSKSESEALSKMAEVFGFEPVVILGDLKKNMWHKRYNALVNEVQAVFSYYLSGETRSTEFAIEERMAENLGIPFFTRNEIERQVVNRVIGKEVKWDGLDTSDCDNYVYDFEFNDNIDT